MTENLDDARWIAALRAKAIDEATPEQLALVEEYAPATDDGKAFEALLLQLEADDDHAAPLGEEETLIASAINSWAEDSSAPVYTPRRSARGWQVVAATATLAAAVAAFWWVNQTEPAGPAEPSFAAVAVPVPPRSPAEEQPSRQQDSTDAWQLSSGAFALEDEGPAPTSVPVGVRLVARDDFCTTAQGRSACFEGGSRFVLGDDVGLELVEGAVTVGSSQAPTVSTFSVQVAGAVVVSNADATYTIETTSDTASVRVERGSVTVKRADGRESLIAAGETWESAGPATASKPAQGTSSAKTLLQRARTLRAQGNRTGAAAAYEKLVRAHPKSGLASASRVTLGRLYLELGKPKKALRSFERYRGSALREDADYGRIEALRALKRSAAAREATRAFITRYPTSRYSAKLRKR